MKKVYLLVIFIIAFSWTATQAQLPQNYAYQKTLREYIGTLDKEDFEVSLSPLKVDPSYFSSTDEVYRTWLFFGYEQNEMTRTRGLRVGASHFTLDAIEANNQVNMSVGKKQFMNPTATAFWAAWDYKGNPHFGSRAVKLRAFVASAVDMMMQDQDHDRGNNERSDFLGLQLIRWAYAYGVAKDVLPQNVRNAYEKGLIKMFGKLEQWGPTGINADIDMAGMPGVLYTAKFVDNQDLSQRARQYVDRLLDGYLSDAGYIDHGSAYDAGYNGISLYFMNWAAQMSDYQPLVDALKKMSKLKAYMTLPDPDGNRFSPFHSNPSSGSDAPHDLWSPYSRDVGIAKYSDDAVYLAIKGGDKKVFGESKMLSQMYKMLNYFHRDGSPNAFLSKTDAPPGIWKHEHWIDINSVKATPFYYQDGLYDRLKSLQGSNSILIKPPFSREGTFTESFADKFLSVKRKTYGTIIFNDRLAWWTKKGQTQKLNGFGGGNMSAFWTPETGSVLLGGGRGTHNGGIDLKDWRTWPVHALSGETADGRAFSSGIQRYPEAIYELNRSPKRVTIKGDLANIYSDPRDGLQGKAQYKRVFNIKENGVAVTTSVISDGSNEVKDLYEILPVYRRNAYRQKYATPTEIEFKVNGSWEPAGTTLKTVQSIRLTRFKGQVYIDFEKPASVKLSPADFYKVPGKKSGLQTRNIMIDLLGSGGQAAKLKDTSVSYFMRSSKAGPNKNWSSDQEENDPPSDSTPPSIQLSHTPQVPDDSQKITISAAADDNSGIKEIKIFLEGKEIKTCQATENCKIASGPYDDGTYRYYATASDNNDNKVTSEKDDLTVNAKDRNAPQVKVTASPNQPDNSQKVTLSAEASDAGGVKQVQLFLDGEKVKTCSDAESCKVSVGPYKDGTYSYRATATDQSGNEKTTDKQTITVTTEAEETDTTPPTVELRLSPDHPDKTQKIQISAEASDASGIKQIQIYVDGEKIKTCSDNKQCAVSGGPYNDGSYSYYAKATDKKGNTKTSAKKNFTVQTDSKDTKAPQVALSHSPDQPDNSQKITLSAEASDAGGIKQVQLFVDGEKVKTCSDAESCKVSVGPYKDGTYSYHATATDQSGNEKTTDKQTITVTTEAEETDTTPPTVELRLSPDHPDKTQKIQISAEASDAGGIKQLRLFVGGDEVKNCEGTQSCTATVGPYKDGSYNYYAIAVDKNGNRKTTEKKKIIVFTADTASPKIDVSYKPSDLDDTQYITFTVSAADTSGIKGIDLYIDGDKKKTCTGKSNCRFVVQPLKAGNHTYHVRSVDNSNNGNETVTEKTNFSVQKKQYPNNPPTRVKATLQKTSQFLKASVKDVSDPDGDPVNLTYDWRINKQSIAVVNMPFDVNFKQGTEKRFKNYTSFKNDAEIERDLQAPGWDADGMKGGALAFDGKDDFVRIPSTKTGQTMREFTVEAWIKPDGWGDDWASLISKPFSNDSWGDPWAVLKLSRNSNKDNLNFQITVDKNKAVSIQSRTDIPSNKWTHITGTYDGKDLKLFINGELDIAKHVGEQLTAGQNTDIFLAKKSDSDEDPQYYKGMMDEVKLLNIALSPDQIKNHYKNVFNEIWLDNTKPGQKWNVAISANDTKSYTNPVITNYITTAEKLASDSSSVSLSQNYPNPFNSSTTIAYNLPKSQKITIKIYDTSGRLVETVFEGEEPGGKSSKPFEASHLASGVYFYQLITPDETFTKKMTHIK